MKKFKCQPVQNQKHFLSFPVFKYENTTKFMPMFNIGFEKSNLYYVIVLQSFETADEGSSSSSSSDQYEDCNDKTSLFKKKVKEKSDDGKTGLQLFEESEEESEQSEDDRFRIRPEYEGETGRKVGRLVFISHGPHPPLFTEYQQIYKLLLACASGHATGRFVSRCFYLYIINPLLHR